MLLGTRRTDIHLHEAQYALVVCRHMLALAQLGRNMLVSPGEMAALQLAYHLKQPDDGLAFLAYAVFPDCHHQSFF